MGILEFLWRVMTALRPSESNDPSVQLAWRWSVVSVMVAIVLVGIASVFWAQGWVPGVSGVALASDVAEVRRSVDAQLRDVRQRTDMIQLMLVKNDIENAMRNSCLARAHKNQDALDLANAKLFGHDGIDGLLDQYQRLTGHTYEHRDCHALLILQEEP